MLIACQPQAGWPGIAKHQAGIAAGKDQEPLLLLDGGEKRPAARASG